MSETTMSLRMGLRAMALKNTPTQNVSLSLEALRGRLVDAYMRTKRLITSIRARKESAEALRAACFQISGANVAATQAALPMAINAVDRIIQAGTTCEQLIGTFPIKEAVEQVIDDARKRTDDRSTEDDDREPEDGRDAADGTGGGDGSSSRKTEAVRVVLRLRPDTTDGPHGPCAVEDWDKGGYVRLTNAQPHNRPHEFQFDRVLGPGALQDEAYLEASGKSGLVDMVINGTDCACLVCKLPTDPHPRRHELPHLV
jgi:hypothetical protein